MKPYWILDKYIIELSEKGDEIISSLESDGCHYVIREYDRFGKVELSPELTDFSNPLPGIVYGSIQFVEKYSAHSSMCPSSYYDSESYKVSDYLTRIKPELYLNSNGFLLPYDVLRKNYLQYTSILRDSKLFIRPNTGKKIFTGLIIDTNKPEEFDLLEKSTGVMANTLVWVSTAKHISAEYRYIIVDGSVISSSQYHKNGEIFISENNDPRARELAEHIANTSNSFYNTFVCDIGIYNDNPYVIELNCINTSAWYLADVDSIVTALNKKVLRDYFDVY